MHCGLNYFIYICKVILKQGTMRMTAEELAQEISRFVNGASITQMEQLAELMANDHPTLQQSKMKLACMFIERMADKPYTDARNEDSKKVANAMVKGFKEHVKAEIVKQDGFICDTMVNYIDLSFRPSNGLPLI